jgi:hypothetical protein
MKGLRNPEGRAAASPGRAEARPSAADGGLETAAPWRFCDVEKAGMVTRYGESGFGGQGRGGFWRRE